MSKDENTFLVEPVADAPAGGDFQLLSRLTLGFSFKALTARRQAAYATARHFQGR